MNFKKIKMFLQVYWMRIIIALISLIIISSILLFLYYAITQYFMLEPFNRRQIMGQFGILFLVFLGVQVIAMPLMLFLQFYFLLSGGVGKVYIEKAKVDVKWDEVIGLENAKKEAWELVKLLKDRALLKSVGGKIIKGTIMIGPPGCGKTYLAKAIASECGLPMLPTVGSEFVGMYVGQGTARMKTLFMQARALAKIEGGCIVFIDEIDSFARPRRADQGFGGGRMDMNATINQFLTEMDGLRNTENNIVVIAATNVNESELDNAIMRAGRFDRKIHVTKPNLNEREEIFKLYLQRIKHEEDLNTNILARKTVWFSPAEIESMVREASLIGLREGRDIANMADMNEAYERVSFGQKSNVILSDDEKKWTAYHEAGHAILYYLIHPTDDVMKATIIPRKGAMGYVFARPSEEVYSRNLDHLMAEIKVGLAGYVAEKMKFGTTSNGVTSDFDMAMRIATSMVWEYGMGKSGYVGRYTSVASMGAYGTSFLSDATKSKLNEDTQDILQTCLRQVEELLQQHNDLFEHFACELLKKEELDFDEIEGIFNSFGLEPMKRTKKEI